VKSVQHGELQDKRHQLILAEVVRMHIDTGEPVSSRAIAHRHSEPLSPATVRNVMADLEEAGFLYQPHTSAGRLPTAAAYQFFVRNCVAQASLSAQDEEWIRSELGAANGLEEFMARAGHILATVSHGVGIIVSPPLARLALEHIRFLLLPDGRVLAVVIARGGTMRDKLVRVARPFTQPELDRTADYLNRQYAGWSLRSIRADLQARLESDRQHYDQLAAALVLCDPSLLEQSAGREVYVEGAAQIATAPEFSDQTKLRELLGAIEEKRRLVDLLTGCIESPEPVYVRIGVDEISEAGQNLALIGAPYRSREEGQGSLGILGPLRMDYGRVITAAVLLARILGSNLTGADLS
jgi:heat-inducible transcriptional repressor